MNIFEKFLWLVCVTVLAGALLGCSKDADEQNGEHFASTQQRALEKAKGVDDMLKKAEDKQRQQLEQMER